MEGKLGRSVCFFTLSDQAYPTFPDYFKTPKNRLSPCHSCLTENNRKQTPIHSKYEISSTRN
ncbi:hypothetical protein [Rubritalea tangerina]|uniref:hypothetical protein n=1 Tax=Rubritalea tangerina TaxID=430798 RepID=UPI00361C6A5C